MRFRSHGRQHRTSLCDYVSPATATITAGQSVAATLTITPVAGYSGTVSFSCGTLPSLATCTFAPTSVTPSNGAAASTKLTITTTAPSAATQRGPIDLWNRSRGLALHSCFSYQGARSKRHRHGMYSLLMVLFFMAGLISLSGCGGANASVNNGGSTSQHDDEYARYAYRHANDHSVGDRLDRQTHSLGHPSGRGAVISYEKTF